MTVDKLKKITYLVFLDETDERRALDFNRLPGPVVQGDDEVEEIRFAQVARRLFFKVRATDAQSKCIEKSISINFNLDSERATQGRTGQLFA